MGFESLEDRRLLAVFSVDNLNDSGAGSLRAAIDAANLSTGTPDEITFSVNGTINIASQLPMITDALTITGPSANLLTINAGNGTDHLPATLDGFRIFHLNDNSAALIDVAISGLTLTGADTPGEGGAIFNQENLTLTNCTLSGNSATGGGGVFSYGAPTTIIGSILSGNSATDRGGGILNFYGTVNISGSTLSENSADTSSGFVASIGGGIANIGGTVALTGSTLSSNVARYSGGGISSSNGTVTITGSTLSGNSSTDLGGGFSNRNSVATVTQSTISGNSSTTGGGLFQYGGVSTLTGTLITGNSAPVGSEIHRYSGTVNLNAFNLIGDSSKTTAQALYGVTAGATDILATSNGTDPTALGAILAPLANNGGPTLPDGSKMMTHALVAGSPAVNAGGTTALINDQRGAPFQRVVGGAVDIGAYEAQSLALEVDTLTDESDGNYSAGDLSLREALELANANPGADTVTFDVGLAGGVINLNAALGQLVISNSVTVTGLGANLLTINAGGTSRVLSITSGTVHVSGLTLTGGNADQGGGLRSDAPAATTLTAMAIQGNTATSASNAGGGIWSAGTLTITASTISNNTAPNGRGGGVHASGGDLIESSTISGNSAGGSGGGLSHVGNGGGPLSPVTISNSTITGNTAGGSGGGVYKSLGMATITGSLISGNTAGPGQEIYRAIINTGVSLIGYNLIGDSSKSTAQALFSVSLGANTITATSTGTDPTSLGAILAPLANNGGPTKTHALVPGSPAIDAINPLVPLVVTPTGVSSNLADFFPASQLIDNSGLGALTYENVATAEHANADSTNSWVTQADGGDYFAAGTPPVLTFILPDRMLLTDIVVWGYAFAPGTFQNNEAKTLEVSFSTDDGANFGAPIILEHAHTGVNSETLSFGGTYLANVVRVRITDNFFGSPAGGGNIGDRVGLGEVRFLGTNNATDQRGAGFPRIVNGRADIGAYELQALPALIVDTLADESDGNYSAGDLSLREALELANGFVGADTISFAGALAGGTINLTPALGQLVISDSVTVTGLGANLLTINAGGGTNGIVGNHDGFRIFHLNDNSAALIDVAISGLTLTGGDTPGDGGAVFNQENLTLTESTLSGNSATNGGGIFSYGAPTTIIGSSLSGNSATVRGGGIFSFYGSTTLTDSTVSGNSANSGGGIASSGGVATIANSTLSGNSVTNFGGGIYSTSGTLTLTSSTLSGNSTSSTGGGIYSSNSTLTLTGSTFSGNSAEFNGGGLWQVGGTSTITGSLITGNSASTGSEIFRYSGPVNLNAFNLIGDSSKTTAQALQNVTAGATDILATSNGTDPTALGAILAPLANNGGPTLPDGSKMKTHALVAGSPARDAGNPGFTSPPDFDQRGTGFSRVAGGRVDIGAFEVQAPSADFDGDGDVDGRDFLAWQRGFGTPAPTAIKSQGDAENDLDVDGADLGVWQLQYDTVPGPLVAALSVEVSALSDSRPEQAVRAQSIDTGGIHESVPELAILVPAYSTAGQVSSGTPAIDDTYVEEIDRALEQLTSLRRYGLRESGEMVARRGVVKRFDLGTLNEVFG